MLTLLNIEPTNKPMKHLIEKFCGGMVKKTMTTEITQNIEAF